MVTNGVRSTTLVAEAERLGFPVVVKTGDPQLVHKSDVGAVKVGLLGAAVRAAHIPQVDSCTSTNASRGSVSSPRMCSTKPWSAEYWVAVCGQPDPAGLGVHPVPAGGDGRAARQQIPRQRISYRNAYRELLADVTDELLYAPSSDRASRRIGERRRGHALRRSGQPLEPRGAKRAARRRARCSAGPST